MKRMKSRKAFTIVELVIVIAVIAILATVLVPTFGNVVQNAKDSAAKQEAKNAYTEYIVENADKGEMPELFLYKAEEGRVVAIQNGAAVGVYATREAALTALVGADFNINELQPTSNDKLFAYGGCVPAVPNPDNVDLFVFAGQSNMMGAPALEPTVTHFTDKALEYKYMPKLRGQATGNFVSAQNPAGEWHYKDMTAAYGENLNDLSYKSTTNDYSSSTYFCPAMSNGKLGFSSQSESETYLGPSFAPYFVTEYAKKYGHSSVYAHMAKGSVQITHYFTEEMNAKYNDLITAYNAANGASYNNLTSVSGAGTAFDEKYNSMLKDYTVTYPDKTVTNKCFVWLQGEGNSGDKYIQYKLKMEVLWEHLQELGFTHFFVLRVGFWGNEGILNVMKAQEDFCAENENCYIVTRAPSLVPYNGRTTENWWISEPSEEYQNCRDRFVNGANNDHFNEKAFQLFAERSAENIHRVLHQGLDPILEEENIIGMSSNENEPNVDNESDYTAYIGTQDFCNGLTVSKPNSDWIQQNSGSALSTDLIPVESTDSVWIQYVFIKSEAHAVGGFYDEDGTLVAPLYYKDFGFTLDGNTGGTTAFLTPEKTNRISIAAIEAEIGKEIAYVRFTAWPASAGSLANTEARIYHAN